MDYASWILTGQRYRDLCAILEKQASERPWLPAFNYRDPAAVQCGTLNANCRLEPIPFDDCFVDRMFFTTGEGASEELVGSALTMRIKWDGTPAGLPRGWQGVVRRSFRDSSADGSGCNTLVGMQLFTISRYRNQGLSGRFMDEMLGFAGSLGYAYCIVPALAPVQFMREYVERPFEELAYLKRDDGLPVDHWARLHVRKGATVIGHDSRSHRFALSVADFKQHLSSDPLPDSGHHLVRLNRDTSFGLNSKNTWQRVHVDVDREIVSFDWGCVWVKYDLS